MAFPTLSSTAKTCPEQPVDDTITSESEAGYVQARPRFTRSRRTFGPISMVVNRADRDALVAFDAEVKASVAFDWTHPVTGATHSVRFKKGGRVKTTPLQDSSKTARLFSVDFTLEEV